MDFQICTSVERIKPGRWFSDGRSKMLKIQDILPSGSYQVLLRVVPETGKLMGDFAVNAIYENGVPACCPYEMDIFFVQSEDDLYPEGRKGPTVRHVKMEAEKPLPKPYKGPIAVVNSLVEKQPNETGPYISENNKSTCFVCKRRITKGQEFYRLKTGFTKRHTACQRKSPGVDKYTDRPAPKHATGSAKRRKVGEIGYSGWRNM